MPKHVESIPVKHKEQPGLSIKHSLAHSKMHSISCLGLTFCCWQRKRALLRQRRLHWRWEG